MADFGLSLAQFNILRILRGAKKAISVNMIKERMVEKSPNTTRLMDKLIDKELIERERCTDDRRIVFVKINQNGLDLLAKMDDAMEEWGEMVPMTLTDEEAQTLSDLLDKLRGDCPNE